MFRYKLLISYNGTYYSGWQKQPEAISIQETIEKALKLLLKEKTTLHGAGRTDAGVHAIGQMAHFDSINKINLFAFLHSLNGILPSDIRIKEIEEVDLNFHARKSALSKEYHYHLWLEKIDDPFLSPYHLHIFEPISIPLLRQATALFVGKHDFKTFANVNGGAKTSIREIFRIDVVEQKGGLRLEFEGEGFLYKMIRNIVGTILEIAKGKKELSTIEKLFLVKDRRQAGVAAPAKGLFLVSIKYPEDLKVMK